MREWCLCAAALAALLTGCAAVGPAHQAPTVALDERFINAGASGSNAQAPGEDIAQAAWIDLFRPQPAQVDEVQALGVEVPTLAGAVEIELPESTQHGKTFRLKGKGVKPIRSHAQGDMLCRVVVETPVNLTPRQKELLQELRTSMNGEDGKQSPQKDSFFSAVRKFFDEMTK